jgi:hypothetical protein
VMGERGWKVRAANEPITATNRTERKKKRRNHEGERDSLTRQDSQPCAARGVMRPPYNHTCC